MSKREAFTHCAQHSIIVIGQNLSIICQCLWSTMFMVSSMYSEVTVGPETLIRPRFCDNYSLLGTHGQLHGHPSKEQQHTRSTVLIAVADTIEQRTRLPFSSYATPRSRTRAHVIASYIVDKIWGCGHLDTQVGSKVLVDDAQNTELEWWRRELGGKYRE